jgi:AbrB family looped-hinge helix DNA binding protein
MKSTVSEKGQVTIPKPLREKLGIRAGQVLDFETRDGMRRLTILEPTSPTEP